MCTHGLGCVVGLTREPSMDALEPCMTGFPSAVTGVLQLPKSSCPANWDLS